MIYAVMYTGYLISNALICKAQFAQEHAYNYNRLRCMHACMHGDYNNIYLNNVIVHENAQYQL